MICLIFIWFLIKVSEWRIFLNHFNVSLQTPCWSYKEDCSFIALTVSISERVFLRRTFHLFFYVSCIDIRQASQQPIFLGFLFLFVFLLLDFFVNIRRAAHFEIFRLRLNKLSIFLKILFFQSFFQVNFVKVNTLMIICSWKVSICFIIYYSLNKQIL